MFKVGRILKLRRSVGGYPSGTRLRVMRPVNIDPTTHVRARVLGVRGTVVKTFNLNNVATVPLGRPRKDGSPPRQTKVQLIGDWSLEPADYEPVIFT